MGDVGRDPRWEPRAGDVLSKIRRNGECLERRVRRLLGRDHRRMTPVVRFFEWRIEKDLCHHGGTDLANWRAWAKSATVVKKGEPE